MCSCGCELAIAAANAAPAAVADGTSERDPAPVLDLAAPAAVSAIGWIARLIAGLVPGWRATR